MKNFLMGLAYIHSKGIMHRDLKPANLMLKGKKIASITVIDYGLSTIIRQENYIFQRCGTPGFVAPELLTTAVKLKSMTYNEKCDIFSAGVIFYIL